MTEYYTLPKNQSIQGAATPEQIFMLDLENVSDLPEILITYAQKNRIIVQRAKNETIIEENNVLFYLTQEETLSFRENIPVEIQVRVLTSDNNTLVSDIFEVSVGHILDEETSEMKLRVKFYNENDLRFSFIDSVFEIRENDHNKLINKDLADQHPISAITGLQDILDNISTIDDFAPVAFTGAAEDLIWPNPLILYCGTASEVV